MRARQQQKSERGSGHRTGAVWKGLAAGVVGGLVASAVMNQFQALLSWLVEGEERSHGAQSMQQGSPQQGIGRALQAKGKDEAEDDAPERLANAIAVGIFDYELTEHEKEVAGIAFHYAMGVTSGALYGAVAEAIPAVKVGVGVPFGAAVWLIADEGLVPAVGLSKSPSEYPLSIHAYAFASHLVFGLTTELVRRVVRDAL
jgi:putative membrane protein